MKKISLFYREGTLDNVYRGSLEPKGNGLGVVNFADGRRGSTLTSPPPVIVALLPVDGHQDSP
jgi:hypothetical protein